MTDPWADASWWRRLLAECGVKGAVLLAAATVAARLLRHQSAALRHAVWAAAALSVLALPLASLAVPSWNAGIVEKATQWWAAPNAASSEEAPAALTPHEVTAAGEVRGAAFPQWLLMVWAVGFGIALLPLLTGSARVGWMSRRAEPLLTPRWMYLAAELSEAIGLERPVRLLVRSRPSNPLTWGFLRPRVLLPKAAESWPAERARIVVAHEFAHIKRCDWPAQILAEIARAVYWFNPLAWAACSRLREESERACDDAVLNSGVEARHYAEHLLELARTLNTSERAWPAALAMARRCSLERRFVAMLHPSLNRRGVTGKVGVLTALAALLLMLPLAALRAPAQSPAGTFFGTVFDSTGGVIPNATVIMSNPEKQTKDMTTTGAAGSFEFAGLPAGKYVLEILKPGFARYEQHDVVLHPGASYRQDVTLQLGKVSERIDVVSSSPAKAERPAAARETPERRRVGGSVQATRLVKMVRPAYPPGAKNLGIEGAVLLEAVIATDGSLVSLRVRNSQIDPDLAKAAVEAVSQWRYEPTLLNGVPVEVITQITVNFQLSQ